MSTRACVIQTMHKSNSIKFSEESYITYDNSLTIQKLLTKDDQEMLPFEELNEHLQPMKWDVFLAGSFYY